MPLISFIMINFEDKASTFPHVSITFISLTRSYLGFIIIFRIEIPFCALHKWKSDQQEKTYIIMFLF